MYVRYRRDVSRQCPGRPHQFICGSSTCENHTGPQQPDALDDINLSVNEGEFLAVVGPSGCGKSTLLQIVAGLIAPTTGQVSQRPRRQRASKAGLPLPAVQQISFPWRTARDNVAFAVEHRMSRGKARRTRHTLSDMVGLGASAAYPWQLSGGMQQRVAIVRARGAARVFSWTSRSAQLTLTRIELHSLVLDSGLASIHRCARTHDVDDKRFLADRVAVLSTAPAVVVRGISTGCHGRAIASADARYCGSWCTSCS
jgi:NitT/TauT family transport system ATP-binding protein